MTNPSKSTHTDTTSQEKTNPVLDYDVFVYGSTPGGCAAAIEAADAGVKSSSRVHSNIPAE